MIVKLICEICCCCNRPVRAGHPFMTCQMCDKIMHKKCKTDDNIVKFRDATYCKICTDANDIVRYNPFYQAPHFANNGLIDDEPVNYIESIYNSSKILENCKTFSITELNATILPKNSAQYLSKLFLNIDGNASNFDNFAVELSCIDHKFSVIGLAETNTNPENGTLYQLNGYSSCYQSRYFCQKKNQFKGKGSGVCLYLHDSLNFNKIPGLSLCNEHIESLFVSITSLQDPTVVGVIYRPPNASLELFNEAYERILSKLNGKKVYILGDFNINILKDPSPSEDKFQEIIFNNGFIPTISVPTHQMPGCSRTCIDNIHTNVVDQSLISGVISDKISHHHPIFTLIELSPGSVPKPDSSDKITIHYDYCNANLEKLCLEIENDIDRFHHSCNTFDSFMQLFQEKIDLSCKLLTPRTTKRNSITNPWITQGLINSIDKKARLYFEWKKTCTLKLPDGDPNKHIYYKEFDKFLKSSINMAKAMCYTRKFEKYSMNSKKTWEVINELRGKNLSRCKDDFVIDGQRVTCRRIIANKFCEYFTSLASNLNNNVLSNDSISLEPVKSFAQFMSNSVSDSIYLEETNEDEIMEVIRDFQNGKASDIPIIVVKKSANLIAGTLARLYNTCIQSGTFPSIFKTGKIIPIYKKDNKECIENYRPVSILPLFGKIFEKVIYKRLYNFFTSKGVLTDSQFGFRKGHSTTHALHKSIDSVTKSLASNKHVLGIFIDLSKAFDTLDHDILLNKLNSYGIRGTALTLLKSYLTNRKQYVMYNDVPSETMDVKFGVPQGSILGPLLFLLYMNDIVNCFSDSEVKFVLYADDTNIFISGPSREATYKKANLVLKHVSIYMKCNLLHINMSKCCYIHFKPASEYDDTCARTRPFANLLDESRSIFINGKVITKVKDTKFLGVVIDSKLNWIAHMQYIRKKLRSMTGAICRIRKSIPAELYLKIYNALFESHLSYGISVWGVVIKERSNDSIFITQKHCIRILFGDLDSYLDKQSTCARTRPYGMQKLGHKHFEKEHTKPIFNRLKILTVQNLFKYHCISEFSKIIKYHCPYSLYEAINISNRATSLTVILLNKSNTFLFNAAKLWNIVHKKILTSSNCLETSINLIKLRTKALLLQSQAADLKDTWTPSNFKLQ